MASPVPQRSFFRLSAGFRTGPLCLLAGLALTACQSKAADPTQVREVAQFYVNNNGLPLSNTAEHRYTRPCLKPLNMEETLLGGPLSPKELVAFVERHKLASTVYDEQPSGYTGVRLTPLPPFESNWLGEGFKSFCFGKWELLKAEAVADAQPITAGANEPYIVPGTQAHATRLTFKLTDVPGGEFVEDLKAHRTLLTRDSMAPEDYGQEFTVVAILPEKVENFNIPQAQGGAP